jgi:two-component system, response regulator PdtaR
MPSGATAYAGPDASLPVVLMVEDDVLVRANAADHLRNCDLNVIEAADVSEALAILEAGEHIDVLFSDVNLPGEMDGIDLARWVREHRPRAGVLLTSGVAVSAKRAAELLDSVQFVQKPYDLAVVEQQIRNLLGSDGRRGNGHS